MKKTLCVNIYVKPYGMTIEEDMALNICRSINSGDITTRCISAYVTASQANAGCGVNAQRSVDNLLMGAGVAGGSWCHSNARHRRAPLPPSGNGENISLYHRLPVSAASALALPSAGARRNIAILAYYHTMPACDATCALCTRRTRPNLLTYVAALAGMPVGGC